MIRVIALGIATLLAMPLSAQQAGDAASTDTEGTFQALIDACDDVDALMLRARIRLQLPHTTEEAAAEAESLLEQGFATCGGGDLETAKTQLSEALVVAEAGAEEKYNAEATAQKVSQQEGGQQVEQNDKATDDEMGADSKPWWKFW